MKKTNQTEVKIFKKVYCKDKGARQRMLQDFEVAIEDIEEMIPEKRKDGKKLFEEKNGAYYFSLKNQFLTSNSFDYNHALGFESRYHCKLY